MTHEDLSGFRVEKEESEIDVDVRNMELLLNGGQYHYVPVPSGGIYTPPRRYRGTAFFGSKVYWIVDGPLGEQHGEPVRARGTKARRS